MNVDLIIVYARKGVERARVEVRQVVAPVHGFPAGRAGGECASARLLGFGGVVVKVVVGFDVGHLGACLGCVGSARARGQLGRWGTWGRDLPRAELGLLFFEFVDLVDVDSAEDEGERQETRTDATHLCKGHHISGPFARGIRVQTYDHIYRQCRIGSGRVYRRYSSGRNDRSSFLCDFADGTLHSAVRGRTGHGRRKRGDRRRGEVDTLSW